MNASKPILISTLAFLSISAKCIAETKHDSTINEALKETILTAITKYETTNINEWAFEVSRYEFEEGTETSSIERFSPHGDDSSKWQLISINQRLPTPKEQETFKRNKNKRGTNISMNLRDLILTDSLTVEKQSQTSVYATFDVYLEQLGSKASNSLRGYLTYDSQEAYITDIEITNTKSFSPMFAATLDNINLQLAFIKINDTVLTERVNLEMTGRFAIFSKLDERSSDIYSNYQYVGQCKFNC